MFSKKLLRVLRPDPAQARSILTFCCIYRGAYQPKARPFWAFFASCPWILDNCDSHDYDDLERNIASQVGPDLHRRLPCICWRKQKKFGLRGSPAWGHLFSTQPGAFMLFHVSLHPGSGTKLLLPSGEVLIQVPTVSSCCASKEIAPWLWCISSSYYVVGVVDVPDSW